jgi:F420-dependent oxidoreductase-like protein
VRIGVNIGPQRGQYRDKVAQLVADGQAAEKSGFASVWIPQYPDDFDAMTAAALVGHNTRRLEIGTAVVPFQSRHPVAMAQQGLSTQAACDGRFVLGAGPSHHWIITDMLGLPYERPAHLVRNYLQVLTAAFAGPGRVDVDNDVYRVHNDLDVTDLQLPILLAALAPVMLRLAGEHAAGTILWMADERAVGDHVVPRITKAAEEAGRPAPRVVASIPVTLCREDEVDAVREWANTALGHAEFSPTYQRLLEAGNATDVGDICAAGDEAAITQRLRSFADAGATDIGARVLAYGHSRDERIASRDRTLAFLASLAPDL